MADNMITKAINILEKFDFFNQRAGYELWNEKPKDIQDNDIEEAAKDIKFLKDFINSQQAQVDFYKKHEKTNGVSGFMVVNGKIVFYVNILDGFRYVYNDLDEVVKELNRMLQNYCDKEGVIKSLQAELKQAQSLYEDRIGDMKAKMDKLSKELKITRDYIHYHNLEYDLLSYSERNGG